MYPDFAVIAKEEGFEGIAKVFESIAKAETMHGNRYRALIANIEAGKVFKKDTIVKWKCRNCGYVHESDEAPKVCPACAHVQAYFEIFCDNI